MDAGAFLDFGRYSARIRPPPLHSHHQAVQRFVCLILFGTQLRQVGLSPNDQGEPDGDAARALQGEASDARSDNFAPSPILEHNSKSKRVPLAFFGSNDSPRTGDDAPRRFVDIQEGTPRLSLLTTCDSTT